MNDPGLKEAKRVKVSDIRLWPLRSCTETVVKFKMTRYRLPLIMALWEKLVHNLYP